MVASRTDPSSEHSATNLVSSKRVFLHMLGFALAPELTQKTGVIVWFKFHLCYKVSSVERASKVDPTKLLNLWAIT